ncbi:MAG: transposase [bacterium]|nr:transposase [bacterium]
MKFKTKKQLSFALLPIIQKIKSSDPLKIIFDSIDRGEDYFFFGYKIHLVVNTKSQLPIDVIVTPGNSADSPYANPLIKKTKGLVSPKLATMDAASDSHENYQICKDYGIIPIIDLNNRWKKPKSKDINLFTELSIPKVGSSLITIGDRFICPATYGPLRKDGRESKRKNRQFIHFKHNGSNYQTNQGLHFQK